MIETFAALLLAHVLADFVLQTNWMAARKRQFPVLILHGLVVLITAQLCLGHVTAWPLLALAATHFAIDAIKTYGDFSGLAGFLTDQGAHLIILATVAWIAPDLWQTGFWAMQAPPLPAPNTLPSTMILIAGAVLATRAGGFATALMMKPYDTAMSQTAESGLPGAGQRIGVLERGLIYLLVLLGELGGIGFLVAAKSILRFGTVSGDRKATEYVIIGTLFSFGWALVVAIAVKALLSQL
ncbi:DUF3307 domain-containing protein [Thalassobius sp. Cn5-15]|uniref:DUF3307 domain-containing protein n=1 Tax=Thalassobius sp. Cn5-15 TaxID=2917763 RepID=UPI001EF1DD6F|nr:DUF3307 domain-containing protein [Thalassobius sp. Cn5-15]MCG7491999.1 DUF3307 domain-containing protein [Thalassobius sp. Cn5-15]